MTVGLRFRAALVASATLAVGVLLPISPPARADHADGPPVLADGGNPDQGLAFNPMTTPTSGGFTRIYGSGFHGVTSVAFGSTPSPSFAVITENLIFAQVPPNPNNNTFVTVTVTDGQGSDASPAFHYTNASASARPSTRLTNATRLVFDVGGYKPTNMAAIIETKPVVGFPWLRPTTRPHA